MKIHVSDVVFVWFALALGNFAYQMLLVEPNYQRAIEVSWFQLVAMLMLWAWGGVSEMTNADRIRTALLIQFGISLGDDAINEMQRDALAALDELVRESESQAAQITAVDNAISHVVLRDGWGDETETMDECVDRVIAERDALRANLKDPVFVHAAMLRGEIAKLDPRTVAHTYGEVLNDNERANLTIAELRAKLAEIERAPLIAELVSHCYVRVTPYGGEVADAMPAGSTIELIARPARKGGE